MSKDVDRNRVFKAIRMRTSLKNDTSWIQKSNQKNKEQENARVDQASETRPILYTPYVLSTAKKFELQAPTEELNQNDEIQLAKSVDDSTASNKDGYGDATVDKSYAHNEDTAEVSAVVHVNGHSLNVEAQPVSLTKESPETKTPVKPEQRLIVISTAEDKEEYADIIFDQSSVEHSEIPVSAGFPVEGLSEDTSGASSKEESRNAAEVLAVLAGNLIPQKTSTETVPTNLDEAGGESAVQPAQGGCDKCHPEQPAEVVVKPSPDKLCVINATPGEETILQDSAEEALDLHEKTISELSIAPATKTATERSCETGPPGKATWEPAEELAKANVEPSSKIQAVPDVSREDTCQASMEAFPDLLERLASESSPATGRSGKKVHSEQTVGEPVKDITKTTVEQSPETSTMTDASRDLPAHQDTVEAVPHLLEKSVSSEPAPEIASEGSCEKVPREEAPGEPVEAAAKANVESKSEIPAVSSASAEQAVLQDIVEGVSAFVTDFVSELPTQPAEPAVQSVKYKVKSSASVEVDLQTRREEVQSEVQPADYTVEQSIEPIPESAEDNMAELSTEDAVEPGDAVQDGFANNMVELTDALDVKPPTSEVSPEPLKDPEQFHTEHTKVNLQSDNTNISEMFQKPAAELHSKQTLHMTRKIKDVCSFCDKIIDGNVKITLSEPLITCHPNCLKCGTCAKALGDLLTPMFLHNKAIICDDCFEMTR